ncbi:MAG: hypothetical protein AB7K36_05215 [Chloroflexota bacterium]
MAGIAALGTAVVPQLSTPATVQAVDDDRLLVEQVNNGQAGTSEASRR